MWIDAEPVEALPQSGLSMKVMQLLGSQGPKHQMCRDTDCLSHGSYGPIRVCLFFAVVVLELLVTSNQKASLASLSP